MKRCSKCGEWKDESEYSRHGVNKSGLHTRCKKCNLSYPGSKESIEARKARSKAHKEAIKAPAGVDKLKWDRKRYYERHKAEIRAKKAIYRAAHRDELRARGRDFIATHPEYADYYAKHPEYYANKYFRRQLGITPTQELLDLKAKQIALVRAIRKQKEAKA